MPCRAARETRDVPTFPTMEQVDETALTPGDFPNFAGFYGILRNFEFYGNSMGFYWDFMEFLWDSIGFYTWEYPDSWMVYTGKSH